MARWVMPNQVKAGPLRYEVSTETPVHSDAYERLCGQCDHVNLRIRVDSGMAELRQFETFVHESLHAMNFVAGTDLSEKQTARLSMALASFLIENDFVQIED